TSAPPSAGPCASKTTHATRRPAERGGVITRRSNHPGDTNDVRDVVLRAGSASAHQRALEGQRGHRSLWLGRRPSGRVGHTHSKPRYKGETMGPWKIIGLFIAAAMGAIAATPAYAAGPQRQAGPPFTFTNTDFFAGSGQQCAFPVTGSWNVVVNTTTYF